MCSSSRLAGVTKPHQSKIIPHIIFLHGLAEKVSGNERIEGRGAAVLVVRGAPHTAAASGASAGAPQIGP